MNELRINRSLAVISTHVDNLRSGTLEGNVDLLSIMRTAKAMQTELTSDQIVGGYKIDAVNQMLRVAELIMETGPAPDHKSLLSIGMACELAAMKLGEYREMHAFAQLAKAQLAA